jgi:Raf kinase inhibitor-like YbhB/YbcL family protein
MQRRVYQRARGRAAAALLLAGSVTLSGCGLLSGPRPLSADAPLSMEVSSTGVTTRNSVLKPQFTCYGARQSPPVTWTGGYPSRTRSYAIVMDDADAPITPRVYWLVVDINSTTTDIQAGVLPRPQARVADNSTGHASYDPPCPTGAPHKYRITVYALNAVLGPAPPGGPQLLATWTAIAPHVIARGTMTVTVCPGPGQGPTTAACEAARSGSGE